MNNWQTKFDELADSLKKVKKKELRVGKRNAVGGIITQDINIAMSSIDEKKSVKFRLPSIMEGSTNNNTT
jgi:hypothetical protein